MSIVIDAEISEEDAQRLKDGEGTMYPLGDTVFLKTVGGYISPFELMMVAFNGLGRRFRFTIDELPDDWPIRPNKFRAAFMDDAITPRRQYETNS